MTEEASLGLVIPVLNDHAGLARLLRQVQQMGNFDQVVVVDDGSDEPVDIDGADMPDVTIVRHEKQMGAGIARNHGVKHVTTSHMIFFDSDDLLTDEFPLLWQDLRGRDFDFCLFRHCDSRQAARGQWGLTDEDAALWREAGLGGRAIVSADLHAKVALAQTANYPWNRIWRVQSLTDHGIRFSPTRVHQDVLPHWMGFLRAPDVLVSDRVAAVHFVSLEGQRLTNLRRAARLDVFIPLREILTVLLSVQDARAEALLPAFWRFAARLLDWVQGNLDPLWHGRLRDRQAAFWQAAITDAQLHALTETDPELSALIRDQSVPASTTFEDPFLRAGVFQ
ncbi:glycosyltransferase family 2 protein [Tateyamaria sp. SN6-1]|uniref:glycosyltransferase family 2 protein n=1 Tax=Tateyamaria sp. SN6-1 TaxID=3092148 RepID=UPI0039F64608